MSEKSRAPVTGLPEGKDKVLSVNIDQHQNCLVHTDNNHADSGVSSTRGGREDGMRGCYNGLNRVHCKAA